MLRALDLATLLQRALRAAKLEAADLSAFEERLRRAEITAEVEEFRRLLATELRKRLLELGRLGDDSLALGSHGDIDVLTASTTELLAMREAVRPLARALSARIARRRKLRRRGRLDVAAPAALTSSWVPSIGIQARRSAKPDLVHVWRVGFGGRVRTFTLSPCTRFTRVRPPPHVLVVDDSPVHRLFTAPIHPEPWAVVAAPSSKAMGIATTAGCSAAPGPCSRRLRLAPRPVIITATPGRTRTAARCVHDCPHGQTDGSPRPPTDWGTEYSRSTLRSRLQWSLEGHAHPLADASSHRLIAKLRGGVRICFA